MTLPFSRPQIALTPEIFVALINHVALIDIFIIVTRLLYSNQIIIDALNLSAIHPTTTLI